MPPKTPAKTSSRPRRSTATPGAGGRFSRSTPTPSSSGRFGLPSSANPKRGTTPKPKPKSKSKSKKGGGLSGLLSSLPLAGLGKKAVSKSSPLSKAKPALALVAAGAGALLGRQQVQKRKEEEVVPVTTEPPTPSTPSVVNDTPQPGAPRATGTPTSPDAI